MIFDPRFSIYDNADTFEQALMRMPRILAALTPETVPSDSRQALHLEKLAALKAKVSAMRKRCLTCGLELASQTNAKFCVSCAAVRRLGLQRERRKVNHDFVKDPAHKAQPKPA